MKIYRFKLNDKYDSFAKENSVYLKKGFYPNPTELIIKNDDKPISLGKLCYFEKYNSYKNSTTREYIFKKYDWVPKDIEEKFINECYDLYEIQNTKKYNFYIPVFKVISFIIFVSFFLLLIGAFDEYLIEFRISKLFCVGLLFLLIFSGILILKSDDRAVLLSSQSKTALIKEAIRNRIDFVQDHNQTDENQKSIKKKQEILDQCYNNFIKRNPTIISSLNVSKIRNYINRLIFENENLMREISPENYEKIMDEVAIREEKRIKNHLSYEGRISASDKRKIKNSLGYVCDACGTDLSKIYGDIGNMYIELHHKIPYSDLKENEERLLNVNDFCVLCPNCHRMMHKLDDAGDIELLKTIVKINKNNCN